MKIPSLKKTRCWLAVVAFASLFPFASQLNADVIVVSNANSELSTVTTKDLAELYQAKKKKLSGVKVKLTALKKGETHEEFLSLYINKSPKQFSAFWKRKLVDGSGIPPKAFKTEEDLLAYIKKTPNSLGYVSTSVAVEGVKTLTVE